METIFRTVKELGLNKKIKVNEINYIKYVIKDEISNLIFDDSCIFCYHSLSLKIEDDSYSVDRYFHLKVNGTTVDLKYNALDIKSFYMVYYLCAIYKLFICCNLSSSLGNRLFKDNIDSICSILEYFYIINEEKIIKKYESYISDI